MNSSFELPVQPHVLKYLKHKLGLRYTLSENDIVGMFLYAQMRRPLRDARRDHVLEDYAERFEVQYGAFEPAKHGLRLTGLVVYKFNKFVQELLETELNDWVDQGTDHGNKINYCIQTFREKYDLTEEDRSYDTMYKAYQRFDATRRVARKRVAAVPARPALNKLERDLKRIHHSTAPTGQRLASAG